MLLGMDLALYCNNQYYIITITTVHVDISTDNIIGRVRELWNFRSLELSFPGTFAPESESSGTFAPRNFRSLELSLKNESSKNFRSKELSLPGTFVPGNESSKNFHSHAK